MQRMEGNTGLKKLRRALKVNIRLPVASMIRPKLGIFILRFGLPQLWMIQNIHGIHSHFKGLVFR
jgi:hypothetical protein